jgi:hypothetical protein
MDEEIAIEFNRLNSQYSHNLEIQTRYVNMNETDDITPEFKTLFFKNGSVTFEWLPFFWIEGLTYQDASIIKTIKWMHQTTNF